MTKNSERTKAWRARHPDIRAYRREEARKWRAAHPDKNREIQRRARDKDRAKELDKRRAAQYRARVGRETLSERQIAKYLRQREEKAGRPQAACCEICGERTKTFFDHDHKTGKFRGWLCNRCNQVLGAVKDSPELLFKLARYLYGSNDGSREEGSAQERTGCSAQVGDGKLPYAQ